MSPPRLAIVGSVNLDFVAFVDRLPAPGETIGGAILSRHPGGKGANQALAAQLLGAEVSLFARVGEDDAAREALALLRARGVDLSGVIADRVVGSGLALIAVDPFGENQIVVAPGANAGFKPEHLPARIETDAVLCQLEIPIETVVQASRAAAGIFCLNLAPAQDVPKALIARADLIIVNEHEHRFYNVLLDAAPRWLAVTYGARGAALFEHGRELVRIEPPKVSAIDATGAGDSFCAGLTVALLEGRPPAHALRFACAAGALAATRRGAQTSFAERAEVERLAEQTGAGA